MRGAGSRDGLAADRRLCPEQIARDFGAGSEVASEAVRTLYEAVLGAADPKVERALRRWERLVGRAGGQRPDRPAAGIDRLGRCYGLSPRGLRPAEMLFSVQTYYAVLVKLLVRRWTGFLDESPAAFEDDPFAWCEAASTEPVERLIRRMAALAGRYDPAAAGGKPTGHGDLLGDLYQGLFPKQVRHGLGEYYTPDWLAEHVLDEVGYDGRPDRRLLDPSCGSGTFLVTAVNRIRAWYEGNRGGCGFDEAELCRRILAGVVGFDLHPLAVLSARANYLIALGDLVRHAGGVSIPIFLRDSILTPVEGREPVEGRFDYVVGNPPWVAWDHLPADYRRATGPLWKRYGLFSLSGSDARHGGGKKDLSMLMLYASADRYLKESGRLGMVITQTLFQTKGAGDGFRRFRLGQEGAWLGVLRVNDMVGLRPFPTAANWTSTILLEKGSRTTYPVPYVKWSLPSASTGETRGDGPGRFRRREYRAEPIDAGWPTSPWFLRPPGLKTPTARLIGPADYRGHLGANTGGANGVYWVRLLEAADGGVRVRNLPGQGKRGVEAVEQVVEPDLLYPLLCWRDVGRYRAVASAHLLLVQDAEARRGIDDDEMARRYPKTYAYLKRFRRVLTERAAYRRYQQGRAFYSMYDVGRYTIAPIKVVWRRMDRRINAAVAGPVDDPVVGPRPVVPQETCVLVACETADEAHYLCGVLNSAVVGFLVASHSVRSGKGFGTPSMLDYVRIGRFEADNPQHAEVAAASRQAHHAAAEGDDLAEIQERIDRLAGGLWGLDDADLEAIGRELKCAE